MSSLVLIVEEDDVVREALVNRVREAGLGVLSANHAQWWVALRRSGQRPAAIVLGIALSGMSGAEFLAVLRRSPDLAQVPVVMISAGGNSVERPVIVAEVIPEPFSRSPLLDALRRALSQ